MRSDGADRCDVAQEQGPGLRRARNQERLSSRRARPGLRGSHVCAGYLPCRLILRIENVFLTTQDGGSIRSRIMKRYLVLLLAAGAAVVARPAVAHHSFSATYLETQTQTIEGEIVQFVFRNPHSFVHVNVKEKDGSVTVYNVEWGGTGQLNNTGVTRETLKAGDVVIISGAPGRNAADHRIRMVTLKRPKDGFTWGQAPGQTVD